VDEMRIYVIKNLDGTSFCWRTRQVVRFKIFILKRKKVCVCVSERERERENLIAGTKIPFNTFFIQVEKKFHSISFIVKQIHLVTRLHTIGDILLQNILLQTTEENKEKL
jgi:hypothetical protein